MICDNCIHTNVCKWFPVEIAKCSDFEEKRQHGEWIRHVDDLFPEESTEECSVCHEEQRITGNDDNFCPNCGADMRKGGEAE